MEFLDREFAQDSRHELLTAAQEVLPASLDTVRPWHDSRRNDSHLNMSRLYLHDLLFPQQVDLPSKPPE